MTGLPILVVGFNSRPIVYSLAQLGYSVFAADFFGDADLLPLVTAFRAVIDHPEFNQYLKGEKKAADLLVCCALELLDENPKITEAIVGSGLDDAVELRNALEKKVHVLGVQSKDIKRARSWDRVEMLAHDFNLRTPRTVRFNAHISQEWDWFPSILKPTRSRGGVGIIHIMNAEELAGIPEMHPEVTIEPYLLQEYIQGRPASITFLGTNDAGNYYSIREVTTNEQFIGKKFLNAPQPFTYCGNQVPLTQQIGRKIQKKQNLLEFATHLGLPGLFGVDFIQTPEGEPVLMEVNPRVPGSLQCSEMATGQNFIHDHLAACRGEKIGSGDGMNPYQTIKHSTKFIFFAPRSIPSFKSGWLQGSSDCSPEGGYYDRPRESQPIEAGEPVFSIYTVAETPQESFRRAWWKLGLFQECLRINLNVPYQK